MELARRTSRQPDHAAENRALVALAETLTGAPEAILPKLVELALSLCQADTAGVSVIERDGNEEVFRWRALAGADAGSLGAVMHRWNSPCGVVVARNAPLLFRDPAQMFPREGVPDMGIVEALTVPFHDGDKPVGTVWVFTRNETRKFDREDARILTSLSRFAGSATKVLTLAEERKQANEALRASEGRLRFLAELAAATQPLTDPDEIMATTARLLAQHLGVDRCVYAEIEDERVFIVTGDYTQGVPSIAGRWPLDGFGPAFEQAMQANQPYVMDDVDQDPRAANDLSAYRAARIQAGICVPLHKAGKLIALMAVDQARPRRWTSEEVELVRTVVGRCWEALERARTARSLRERDERLDFAVELAGIGFWHCDLPFDELNWDERVKEHFWLPPDARVTIDTFYERIHPDDRARTRQAIETSIHNATPYDIDYRTVDPETGAIKWIRALGGTAYGPDGLARRFDGVTVDATVRKLHEERLARLLEREREQARLLEQVADAALTIHATASLDSVLRVITEEARRIIGAHQSVTSLTLGNDWSQAVSAPSLSPKYEAFRNYQGAPTGKGIYALVCQTNRPMRLTQAELVSHPAWRNFSGEADRHPPMRGWLAAPFIGRSGKNLGLIQLSDKYEGEFTEQDEAILIQLAHIASVAIENARLYDELRDQDRRKDEFLATLAHELRNPLAPIRTGLTLLQMARDEAQARRIREMMERQVGHMVRMVDDLLDVSRITRGKVELRKARVELGTVLESALETSRPLIEAAGHVLSVSLPTEPLWLMADPTRLSQILANLLNNAAKYTPAGGRIRVAAEREGAHVVVRVEDTGVGIPPEMLPKVFDMFTQVGRSIERAQGGLGIGLTLVRRLVELHGGTVEAASDGPSRGSIFTVRLPLGAAEEAKAVGPSGDAPAKGATGGLKVLVVDDNVDGAESLAELLQLTGHTTEVAHTGPSALVAARAFEPDVVFLDIGLPGMTGYEVAQRLRAEEGLGRVVLVALTGWGTEEDRRQAREAGFDYHLTKPVDLQEVQRIVDGVAAKMKRVA
ncbi:GAF domain-containing protein [Polyangium jinanense]|uniref:histidine kinase n=1 Tax=Polyangium jinanense TaxID=2829994 RepID=A0A9X3X4D6_9BACT|nr:GAF domain-containing protein [Polyangium jinanense]MDC3954011.1 GAF domain-containing protein [Polyangium jinanense]MDC3957776.1 GAF domain-containing protein [Polyangium jinanense]MDC3978862.1 GAF domain-containing protein [Polyangium jinanense]MDC3982033.1 GAF domain-containing protein [Polyangium jinanense]